MIGHGSVAPDFVAGWRDNSGVRQAFKYELDPTNVQRSRLMSFCGTSRFAWNWGLEEVTRCLDAGERVPTAFDLNNLWNQRKQVDAPWWHEVSAHVPQQAFSDLHRALGAFWRQRAGFPRFKAKGRSKDSFRVRDVKARERHALVPRIGWIRTKEPTTKLRGRITSATVSRVANRWFVSFAVEVDRAIPAKRTGPATGIDLGLTAFATLSDGTVIPHPKPYKAGLRKLRRLNKEVARKQEGSANRRKAVMKLARHHAKVANIRKDCISKATTELARTKPVLVIEDLHVAGMKRNRHLARAINDAGWGEFRRQLVYKAEWYGSALIIADRFMPSSKTCSECGWVKHDLTLKDREFRCEDCGIVLDRDLNAARNLQHVAASVSETINACGDGSSGPATSGETAVDEAGTRPLVIA